MTNDTVELGVFTLSKGSGFPEPAHVLKLVTPVQARFLRFQILENHQGTVYPATNTPPDNGFVGLSEIRFFDAKGARLQASVAAFSSELSSRERRAAHLLDGSGLETATEGWDRQGLPFYGWEVAYRQQFSVEDRDGRFRVCLADWNGTIARVTVNGKAAGWISAPPYDCDVTRWVRKGNNVIEVSVIGSLKNPLGPHHGSPRLGAAWPRDFQTAPESGPPPGRSYHTIAYGLFKPFQLKVGRAPHKAMASATKR